MRKFEYDKKLKKELNIYERAIYNELYSYSNPNKGVYSVYPNIVTIASELGINKNTVIKYLKTLATKGYINVFKKKLQAGNKNVYSLNVVWSNLKEKIKENSFITRIIDKANKTKKLKNDSFSKNIDLNNDKSLDNFKTYNDLNISNSQSLNTSYLYNDETWNSYNKSNTENGIARNSYKGNKINNSCKNSNTDDLEYSKILENDPDIKDKIAMVKAVTNPYHEISMPLIRNLSKLTYQEIFNLLDDVFEKIKDDGNKVSIKYVENEIKTSLRWNEFLE